MLLRYLILLLLAWPLFGITEGTEQSSDVSNTSGKATLEIHITGLKKNKGYVRIALYNSPETFLEKGERYRAINIQPEDNSCTTRIEDLPYGTYAIAFYHDQNADNKHNKGMIFVGMERYGFSNNSATAMGAPPSFDKARFDVDKPLVKIEMEAR